MWAAPTWPVKLCFFVGMLLLAVQSVSEILKEIVAAVETVQSRKALPSDGKEDQA